MAEQLGAAGGRPAGDVGPDWSQTAKTSSAPAWATSDTSTTDTATKDTSTTASTQGAPDGTAQGPERPTDGHLDPDLDGDVPAAGGPGPEEREAVRESGHRPGQVRTRSNAQTAAAPHTPAAPPAAAGPDQDDAPSEDDEDLSSSGTVGQPVIEQILGGTVIEVNGEPVG